MKTLAIILGLLLAGILPAGVFTETLPRTGAKLERGEPYMILAVGDSVTHTGKYHEFLARRLAEKTGNTKIATQKKARSGCSADATSRNFDTDVAPFKPDLLLIMYGLNDQAAFAEPETYLANLRYIADRAVKEFGCDVLFLQPTPHPSFKDLATEFESAYPWRTGVFAAYLAHAEKVYPVVRTFGAFSRDVPAKNPVELYTQMLKFYPPKDHIHPSAAGHEKMAETVFEYLTRTTPPEPMEFHGRFRWPAAIEVEAHNRTPAERIGKLIVYMPDRMPGRGNVEYKLRPGEKCTVVIPLPELKSAQELLIPPYSWYIKRDTMGVTVVDFAADGTARATAVSCPRSGADALPPASFTLPAFREESGRVPVVQDTRARELVYTRYASALRGETPPDDACLWSTLGAPHQARGNTGPMDFRKSPEEKRIAFAFRAGTAGLFVAAKIRGDVMKDAGTFYFDPRPAEELNTIGPYYWLDVRFLPEGKLRLHSGETADRAAKVRGSWRAVEGGAELELFIPYTWMKTESFPASGDMGFSLVWRHTGPEGEKTTLNWGESGHSWTPLNYGVIRLQEKPDIASLPFRIRLE